MSVTSRVGFRRRAASLASLVIAMGAGSSPAYAGSPAWCRITPRHDALYKNYVGRASGRTLDDAFHEAVLQARREAVEENFGFEFHAYVGASERDDLSKDRSERFFARDLEERSRRVILEDFERVDSYSARVAMGPDSTGYQVCIWYRYPVRAIQREKGRLARLGSRDLFGDPAPSARELLRRVPSNLGITLGASEVWGNFPDHSANFPANGGLISAPAPSPAPTPTPTPAPSPAPDPSSSPGADEDAPSLVSPRWYVSFLLGGASSPIQNPNISVLEVGLSGEYFPIPLVGIRLAYTFGMGAGSYPNAQLNYNLGAFEAGIPIHFWRPHLLGNDSFFVEPKAVLGFFSYSISTAADSPATGATPTHVLRSPGLDIGYRLLEIPGPGQHGVWGGTLRGGEEANGSVTGGFQAQASYFLGFELNFGW